jgi:hypothetical protein
LVRDNSAMRDWAGLRACQSAPPALPCVHPHGLAVIDAQDTFHVTHSHLSLRCSQPRRDSLDYRLFKVLEGCGLANGTTRTKSKQAALFASSDKFPFHPHSLSNGRPHSVSVHTTTSPSSFFCPPTVCFSSGTIQNLKPTDNFISPPHHPPPRSRATPPRQSSNQKEKGK